MISDIVPAAAIQKLVQHIRRHAFPCICRDMKTELAKRQPGTFQFCIQGVGHGLRIRNTVPAMPIWIALDGPLSRTLKPGFCLLPAATPFENWPGRIVLEHQGNHLL